MMDYDTIYNIIKEGGLLSLVIIEGYVIRWLYLSHKAEKAVQDKAVAELFEARHNEYVGMLKEVVKQEETVANHLSESNKLEERLIRVIEHCEKYTQ